MSDNNSAIGGLWSKLQEWWADQCDGEWEHEYGIRIDTMDNPGWIVYIDLTCTHIGNAETGLICDNSSLSGDTWHKCYVTKGTASTSHLHEHERVPEDNERLFVGYGGSRSLEFILSEFLNLTETTAK